MTLEHWSLFLLAAIGLSLTPGPNGLLSLSHGMRFGVRPTVMVAVGGIAGFLVLIGASLSGLGALLATSERAFLAVKWIGAAYLIYLGIRLWFAPAPVTHGNEDMTTVNATNKIPSSSTRFSEGFLVAVSNPKALIFFAAFLPQFMVPDVSLLTHFLVLGGTFAAVEFIYEIIVAAMAQRIAPWLGRHGRWFNRGAGTCFIIIGGLMTRANR
ncbi:MAG: LysE family translocator [Burkholderiaceae bacterium]